MNLRLEKTEPRTREQNLNPWSLYCTQILKTIRSTFHYQNQFGIRTFREVPSIFWTKPFAFEIPSIFWTKPFALSTFRLLNQVFEISDSKPYKTIFNARVDARLRKEFVQQALPIWEYTGTTFENRTREPHTREDFRARVRTRLRKHFRDECERLECEDWTSHSRSFNLELDKLNISIRNPRTTLR